MSEFPPLVYVDLKQAPKRLTFKGRQQRWYWVALSGDNFRVLARSSERYTNRNDAVKAIHLLFGDHVNVYLRQSEQGNQVLRMAIPL